MDIAPYLRLMVQKNGSDLYFSTGAAPSLRTQGRTLPIGDKRLAPGDQFELEIEEIGTLINRIVKE